MPATYDVDSFMRSLTTLEKAMHRDDKDDKDDDEDMDGVLQTIRDHLEQVDQKHVDGYNRLASYHGELQRAYEAERYGNLLTKKAMAKRIRKVEKQLKRYQRGKAAGEMIYAPGRDDTGIHAMTNAGGERAQMTKALAPLVALAKSLVPQATRAQLAAVVPRLAQALEDRGLKPVPFDRELAAKLRVTQAINVAEYELYKSHGLLPSRVDLEHPQPRRDAGTVHPLWCTPYRDMAPLALAALKAGWRP